jgi:ribosomal-protein-alanine N-acetyltransferase
MLFATERLTVRKATLHDMDALLAIFGDPENVRHYNQGLPWTRPQVRELVDHFTTACPPSAAVTPGVVLLKPGHAVVGFGGVFYDAQAMDEAELAFIFRKEHWGKGLATEFARAAIAAAFAHPGIASVNATVKPVNVASVRVLEKCGLQCVRYMPEKDRLLYRVDRPRLDVC